MEYRDRKGGKEEERAKCRKKGVQYEWRDRRKGKEKGVMEWRDGEGGRCEGRKRGV